MALVIESSIQRPARMPYYCAMAALGSLAGCIWIYWLAKKGGEAFFHRHTPADVPSYAKRWVQSHAFLSAFIPVVLPLPFPFKVGLCPRRRSVSGSAARTFVLALLLARSIRYGLEGILAVRYGDAVLVLLIAHKAAFALGVLALFLVLFLVNRLFFRHSSPAS